MYSVPPHGRRIRKSGWGCSRRAGSLTRCRCSTYQVCSGHSWGRPRWADRDTVQFADHTCSCQGTNRPEGSSPPSNTCTLGRGGQAVVRHRTETFRYTNTWKAQVFLLTPAALCGGVAVVTDFAVLTRVSLRVIQAFETGTCASVTRPGVVHVNVVVTLAGHAAPSWNQRVSIVTGGALVTPGS